MNKSSRYTFVLSIILMLFTSSLTWAQSTSLADPRVLLGGEVNISFAGIPEGDVGTVSRAYPVDRKDGTIRMPYLKSPVRVVNLTARQVEILVTKLYIDQEIYTNPIVIVKIVGQTAEAPGQRFIHITGYVGAKKNMPYREGITLIETIIDCGDITDFGSRYIQVTRKGITRTYDYFSAKDRAIVLLPGDMINVPRRSIWEDRPETIGP